MKLELAYRLEGTLTEVVPNYSIPAWERLLEGTRS